MCCYLVCCKSEIEIDVSRSTWTSFEACSAPLETRIRVFGTLPKYLNCLPCSKTWETFFSSSKCHYSFSKRYHTWKKLATIKLAPQLRKIITRKRTGRIGESLSCASSIYSPYIWALLLSQHDMPTPTFSSFGTTKSQITRTAGSIINSSLRKFEGKKAVLFPK